MNLNAPKFNYNDFYNWMLSLVEEGKTSGKTQTIVLSDFTALNTRRMSRLNKTILIDSELLALISQIEDNQKWLVITEAWCGDSAQNLPVIGKIADLSEKIELEVVLRDENLHLMDTYHTNGSNSIPKLIAFNDKGEELFTWGPRPVPAQELLTNWKNEPEGRNWEAFETDLHTWYARDKSKKIQHEFSQLLRKL